MDDADGGVTDVVRGDDILPVTPAQNVLADRLGLPRPTHWHLPLLVGPDGRRLAKRHGDTRVAAYRAAGLAPGRLLTALARASRWIAPDATVAALRDILPTFDIRLTPREPLVWDDARLS